jgi:hypothetical protein
MRTDKTRGQGPKGDCHSFIGTKTRGYGMLWWEGRMELAHRVAWQLANGPITGGLLVLHRCDNCACVRVDHLFLGTHADNMADMKSKGRGRGARLAGEANPQAKLTATQVTEIRCSPDSGRGVANRFGVSEATISFIRSGKRWATVGDA